MTVSHKKARSGNYYIKCMTSDMLNDPNSKKLMGGRVDDYYSAGAKEPPGQWYLANKNGEFGIKDGTNFEEKDVEIFRKMCNGFDLNGQAIVKNAGEDGRVALHDFTFSAPKEMSVIWSQAGAEHKALIQKAQNDSVRDALDFFSEKGAWSRRGAGGGIKVKAEFVAAIFEHGSSRADDPQLHSHATILNTCKRVDGTTGAIETRMAMKWQGATASLYHAGLAFKMREMGASVGMNGKIPEINGVPRHVIEEFSRRRMAIEAAVEKWQAEHGIAPDVARASKGLVDKATIETRDAKNELSREELEKLWLERGAAMGFSSDEVLEVFQMGDPIEVFTDEMLLKEARLAVENLTETDAVFTEPTLYTAVAVHLCGRASVSDIKKSVAAIMSELVYSERISDTKTREIEKIFSTKEMLEIERDLVFRVEAEKKEHMLDKDFAEKFIATRDEESMAAAAKDIIEKGGDPADARGFELEQKQAILHVALNAKQVTTIEGTAGAGKTFTSRALAAMYKSQGYEVHGLSSAWAQALNLKEEAHLDSGRAIAGWLNDIKNGKLVLDKKSLIIVDESGMVGARDMRDVIRAVQDAGAKLVLLGDTKQQSSVSSGDALRIIVGKTGSARLNVIRRQRNEEDRAAVFDFFDGRASEGMDRYASRTHIEIDSDATNKKLVSDWTVSHIKNSKKTHLVLALDNKSVDDLNRLIHQSRKDIGDLGPDSVKLCTMDSADKNDLIEFNTGDNVVFRVNNRGLKFKGSELMSVSKEYARDVKTLIAIEAGIFKKGLTRDERAAQKIITKENIDAHLRGMIAKFGEKSDKFSKEITLMTKQYLASNDERPSLHMRLHSKKTSKEISDLEASDVFNRVRGTIESIDNKTGKMTIKTEEGKNVNFDPADKKWEHENGGIGIQLDYASTIYASQGLTRDVVFVKDATSIGRRQIGVAMSRHRDDCHIYIDKTARYEEKMKFADAADWHHIDKFKDKECIDVLKKSYSRDKGNESTLDYKDWRQQSDDKMYFAREKVTLSLLERARKKIKSFIRTDKAAANSMPFQLSDAYKLESGIVVDASRRSIAQDRLAQRGISGATMIAAEKQGFLTHNEDGTTSFNGRRPSDNAIVNRITGDTAAPGALRDRYPAILHGSRDVHIVSSGEEALAIWSHGGVRPTVIVAHGDISNVVALKHIRSLLESSAQSPTIHHNEKMSPEDRSIVEKTIASAAKRSVCAAEATTTAAAVAAKNLLEKELLTQKKSASKANRI